MQNDVEAGRAIELDALVTVVREIATAPFHRHAEHRRTAWTDPAICSACTACTPMGYRAGRILNRGMTVRPPT